VTLEAGPLPKALKPARPHQRRKIACMVNLSSNTASQTVMLEEARLGQFVEALAAQGDLGAAVQVDGKLFARMAASFPPATVLRRTVIDGAVEVRAGGSSGGFRAWRPPRRWLGAS